MYTRRTSDYSPTLKGSKEENRAIAARRELLGWFAARVPAKTHARKTWTERMQQRARGFEPR